MFLHHPRPGGARAGRTVIALLAFLGLSPAPGLAAVSAYSQDFEGMSVTDPGALGADGWLVYGNVFTPAMAYIYGYGPFPAPNAPPPAFSALVDNEGGPTQGGAQLSVFSDYENADHANGNWIEANVFQERVIDATDTGETWYFEFDAKRGDLAGGTTAVAFIKTLAPPPSYALTNFVTVNMRVIPTTWRRYGLSFTIAPGMAGHIFQFGFASTATHYEPSAVFYDNIELSQTSTVDVAPGGTVDSGVRLTPRGNPASGQTAQVLDFSVPRNGPVTVRVYDVRGALVATLVDAELGAGTHQATWRGHDASGRAVASGLYLAEVVAGGKRAVAKLHRLR